MIKAIRFLAAALVVGLTLASIAPTRAETVVVKYRGPVDLAHMRCESITRSSFINRLCYDAKERYVVIQLDATYYHYCGVSADVVANWRAAESWGATTTPKSKAASTAGPRTGLLNQCSHGGGSTCHASRSCRMSGTRLQSPTLRNVALLKVTILISFAAGFSRTAESRQLASARRLI